MVFTHPFPHTHTSTLQIASTFSLHLDTLARIDRGSWLNFSYHSTLSYVPQHSNLTHPPLSLRALVLTELPLRAANNQTTNQPWNLQPFRQHQHPITTAAPATMADVNSDSDPDSAAMAEAMGFTGFGMQRSKKRKLTPPAQTGANNAPLGKRRPLNLPQPVASGAGAGSNADEIGLDFDDDPNVEPIGDRGEVLPDVQTQAAGLDALSVNDAPPGMGDLHPHHSLPPKPQQQQGQHHHAGKAVRHPGGRAGGGSGQVPWWEREWDPRLLDRMVENPWDRLEKQRGLGARGTWPTTRGARGGDDAAAAVPGGVGAGPAGAGDGDGGGAMDSLEGGAQAAIQATVS